MSFAEISLHLRMDARAEASRALRDLHVHAHAARGAPAAVEALSARLERAANPPP